MPTNATAPDEVEYTLLLSLKAMGAEWLHAMSSAEFYLQMMLVVVAVSISALVARITRRYYKSGTLALEEPWLHSVVYTIIRLQAPLLTMLLLVLARSLAGALLGKASIIAAANTLALVWLAMRVLRLMVHNKALARFFSAVMLVLAILSITGLMDTTTATLDAFAFELGKIRISALGVIKGLVLLVFLLWLARTVNSGIARALHRTSSLDYNTRELISKLLQICFYFIAVVVTLTAIGIDLTALAVFGGALGVGIGLGLQKITSNFISGIILLFEKSIKVGDVIQIGEERGWVRNLAIRYTLIETTDGKELLIPNEEMMAHRVINWTYTNTRAQVNVPVSVSYDSDIERAIAIMTEVATQYPRSVHGMPVTCFVKDLAENGIVCQLSFWVGDINDGMLSARSDVLREILQRFKAEGIVIPYPKREVTLRQP